MNDDGLHAALDDLLTLVPDATALPASTARRVRQARRLKVVSATGLTVLAVTAAAVALPRLGAQERLVPAAPRPATTSPPAPPPTREPATGSPSADPGPPPSHAPATVRPPSASARRPPDAAPGPSASASPTATTALRVVLRPDGLALAGSDGATRPLVFGTDGGIVRTALDFALGAGTAAALPDCGSGVTGVQYRSLSVLLAGGRLVGWSTASPAVQTGDGVGVGSTLSDLRGGFARVTVSQGSLGVEWSAGALAGFLDGTAATSRVTGLRAGQACLAR